MIFDYKNAAARAGIPSAKLDRLTALMRAEFPNDETMAELHVLRAILAVEQGAASLEEILGQGVTS